MSLLSQIAGEMWAIEPGALDALVADAQRTLALGDIDARAAFGAQAKAGRPYEVTNGVAMIPVRGPLMGNPGFFARLMGVGSYADISMLAQAMDADPDVRSIVLDIDSPGGSVTGMLEAAAVLGGVSKPVTAYVGGVAASAAYLLAASADRIVASPAARVGSLGAMMQVARPGPKMEEAVKVLTFVSELTPLKNADPAGKEGAAAIQAVVNEVGRTYLEAVARARGLDGPEAVAEKYGRGAVFAARNARERGMVDAIQLVGASPRSQDNEESAMEAREATVDDTPGLGASRTEVVAPGDQSPPGVPGVTPHNVTNVAASLDVEALVAAEIGKLRQQMQADMDAKVEALARTEAIRRTRDVEWGAACGGRPEPSMRGLFDLIHDAKAEGRDGADAWLDRCFGEAGAFALPGDIAPPSRKPERPAQLDDEERRAQRYDALVAEHNGDHEAALAAFEAELNGGDR